MDNVLAVILGGGQGTRLFPLTHERSKPAVPLGGKYRLIDIPVSNCINSGIIKIYILTQFNSASLNRHVARTFRFSQFSSGFVDILAAEQTPDNPHWFQGTADAVRQNFRHIKDVGADTIIILSGDHLYKMDYSKFINAHWDAKADVTVSVTAVPPEEASEFGLLKVDDTGRIVEFKEKPRGDALESMRVNTELMGLSPEEAELRPYLASMGIYVFNLQVLEDLLNQQGRIDFGREVIPSAINNYKVNSYLFKGYWEDIGTIGAFFRANIELTDVLPRFNFFDTRKQIYTRPRFLPGTKIRNAQTHDSIICEGCIINEAIVRRSVVGIRSRIESGSRLDHVLMMGADDYESIDEMRRNKETNQPNIGIGHNCTIKRAIIDKNARIGNNVQLLNDKGIQEATAENYVIRDGIIIIPKGAIVPDGTVV
ncbi:MAG TPA: glucose-1-phosphate adenylyltransferase [Acidobacteriota bacterium]|nr:glucose-1-phosphate adenylyltransferase [Acidobacteriota bacterium]HMZ78817.1 glucose-1-phosphate adenylyltransferase [Acidobacteriota bacterium]HNB72881.1 glucose-1-phosphate adenylyltransferase [Acidobacteriota bacterium]HNC42821.1 glucose-1-phosphate adenylyltransferase [Acidobacteriota bacterium]HND18973.1 glucose-1-phosphate adenylyltransferase [Acidobacteriota bacterium]